MCAVTWKRVCVRMCDRSWEQTGLGGGRGGGHRVPLKLPLPAWEAEMHPSPRAEQESREASGESRPRVDFQGDRTLQK